LATTPDEAAGKAIAELSLDEHLRGHIRDVRASGPGTRRTFELKAESRGKQSFVATLACVGGGDDSQSVVTVLRDTTWETQVEQMKNDFISHVSHELRTPLSSIKAYVEMLLDGEADDEKTRKDFLEVVQTEANRLGRLIDDIL